jgi:sacsin
VPCFSFSAADFESIQNIGNSMKKGSVNKTGRFGIGFNSVYHLTDLPCFISGRYIVYFDPHAKFLPNGMSRGGCLHPLGPHFGILKF